MAPLVYGSGYKAIPANDDVEVVTALPRGPRFSCRPAVFCIIALFSSLALNATLLADRFHKPWKLAARLPSRYAGLTYTAPLPTHEHAYTSPNQTLQDTAWQSTALTEGLGVIALDIPHSANLGLPRSQAWPWSDTKEVYVLSAVHQLHCINLLRLAINDAHFTNTDGESQWEYGHLLHCLDVLRQEVMCNADDRPAALEHSVKDGREVSMPVHVDRVCRDWEQMERWGRVHSACYKPGLKGDGKTELERFMFCPDGSRPWEEV